MKLLFLCHGNICRSPMAERIMQALVEEKHLEQKFEIASAAVSDEERGNPIYPPARRKLAEHDIPSGGHAAHRITPEEFDRYDRILLMDRSNLRLLASIVGRKKAEDPVKVHLLMEFAGDGRNPVSREKAADVADPWYTGDFEITYQDIVRGCNGLLTYLLSDPV